MSKPQQQQNSIINEFRALLFCLPIIFFIIILDVADIINEATAIFLSLAIIVTVLIIHRRYQDDMAELRRKAILQEHDSRDTKESQSLLNSVMENLSDPFMLLDTRKRILMANKSAKAMFGSDIMRKDLSLYIRNQYVVNAINQVIQNGGSETVEFKSSDQIPKHYLLRIHALDTLLPINNDDRKKYIFLSIYNITALKQAEQMRVDFVANASHELRTPLAALLGFVETLQGPAKDDPAAQQRFLKIMNDEANRMTRLVEDLLSLSRIEREAHIPPEGEVDINQLLHNVCETLSLKIESKNMTTTITDDDHVGSVVADYDQLTQVFQNLIDNAVKYGHNNTNIDIRLSYHKFLKPNADRLNNVQRNHIHISITNKGQGIPPEHIPRLTERFYRVDPARSRSLGSTGLGLAIVKHIVNRHKGSLFFESNVGQDTTVNVILPKNQS